MKKVLYIALFLSALLVASCGSKEGDSGKDHSDLSPEEVMEKYFNALSEEDADAVLECLDAEEYDKTDAEREIKRYVDLESYDIVECKSEEGVAFIKVKVKNKSGRSRTVTYRMAKKDQGWIIFN